MTRAALDAWLEPRLAAAPPELAAAVRELIAEAAGDPGPLADRDLLDDTIPGRLAVAALRGFDGVVAGSDRDSGARSTALRLLAADAVLTYAFEAAADLGVDAGKLADRLGPRGALGALLADGRSS